MIVCLSLCAAEVQRLGCSLGSLPGLGGNREFVFLRVGVLSDCVRNRANSRRFQREADRE